MGKSLYRYRRVTDYSIEELINNQIIGTTNDLMNDPYDCRYYYDEKFIKSFLDDNKIIKEYLLQKFQFKDDEIHLFIDFIAAQTEDLISKTFYTACFSECVDKEIMWSHYSDKGKGFVIEYDEDDIKNKLNAKKKKIENIYRSMAGLFRIKYVSERDDLSEFLRRFFIIFSDQINADYSFHEITKYKFMQEMAKNIVTHKNIDWKYEGEYRLIWPNFVKKGNMLQPGHECIINSVLPKAIYIGENCSKKDRIILYLISKNKNIKLYQMKVTNESKKFRLEYEEINDILIDAGIHRCCFSVRDEYYYALNNRFK